MELQASVSQRVLGVCKSLLKVEEKEKKSFHGGENVPRQNSRRKKVRPFDPSWWFAATHLFAQPHLSRYYRQNVHFYHQKHAVEQEAGEGFARYRGCHAVISLPRLEGTRSSPVGGCDACVKAAFKRWERPAGRRRVGDAAAVTRLLPAGRTAAAGWAKRNPNVSLKIPQHPRRNVLPEATAAFQRRGIDHVVLFLDPPEPSGESLPVFLTGR